MMREPDPIFAADRLEMQAWSDMIAAAPAALVAHAGLAMRHDEGVWMLGAPKLPVSMFNRAVGLDHRPRTDAELDRLLQAIREGSIDPWVQLAERDAPLLDRLRARGLVPAPRPAWAKVVRDVADVSMRESPLRVARLEPSDTERSSELGAVLARAHGMPPPLAAWIAALARRPNWHAFATFDPVDEAIVGGGLLFQRDGDDGGWLGLGGTLPSHRRRGGQLAIMAARIAHARKLGATWCATETGEPAAGEANPSLANMYRAGFRKVSSRLNLCFAS